MNKRVKWTIGLACAAWIGIYFAAANSSKVAAGAPQIYSSTNGTLTYPEDDVVIAQYDVTEMHFGAVPNDGLDDSVAFQAAMAAAATAGGGVVFVPDGDYDFTHNITIPTGVTLRGDWRNPDDTGTSGIGTLLKANVASGNAEGTPFITLSENAAVSNLAIMYPQQVAGGTVKVYPYAIQQTAGNNGLIENITLFNAYQGIRIGPSNNQRHTIKDIYGTVLKTGISIDWVTDVGRIEAVHFQPKYWEGSGLPGSPAAGSIAASAVRSWIRTNGVGVLLMRTDWEFVYNVTTEGYGIGLQLSSSANGNGNGQMGKLNLFGGNIGMQIDAAKDWGYSISDSTISAGTGTSPVALKVTPSFNGTALFQNVTFGGNPSTDVWIQLPTGTGAPGRLSFMNSTFTNWGMSGGQYAIVAESGDIAIEQSEFLKAAAEIRLAAGVKAAAILGNTFTSATPKIQNETTSASDIQINHAPTSFEVPATVGHKAKPTLTKPASTTVLINAKDAPYSAAGDGTTDDSAAIQAAIQAAAAQGGGTVFLPVGKYVLSGSGLIVRTGVELRGVFDAPFSAKGTTGTEIYAEYGKGDANATPLIRLESGAGVSGFRVYYPEQIWDSETFVFFPWTIRSLGPHAWVKNVILANSYQGIDFGTNDSTGHYISRVGGITLKKGIFVGNNGGEGWMENVQFNPQFLDQSSYPNRPISSKQVGAFQAHLIAVNKSFLFGSAVNEHLFNNFAFGASVGATFVPQTTGTFNGNAYGFGFDGIGLPMSIEAPVHADFVNTEFVTKESLATRFYLNQTAAAAGSTAHFYNSIFWGQPNLGVKLAGGELVLQQAHFQRFGSPAIQATGGTLKVQGSLFSTTGTLIDAQSGTDRVDFIGNMRYGYTPSSDLSIASGVTQNISGNVAMMGTQRVNDGSLLSHPPDWNMIVEPDSSKDGHTELVNYSGFDVIKIPTSKYAYFQVDPAYIASTDSNVTFELTYFDDAGTLSIQYNSTDPANPNYKKITITKQGTNQWVSTGPIQVTDAQFRHSQNYQADFRIASGAAYPLYVKALNVH